MVILSFDTSGPHCAVAVLSDGRVLAQTYEPMAKGQVARLMPLVTEVLAEAGIGVAEAHAIAVGIGPGNFTGLRISVAAARGLALARGIPAIGVSAFEVMRADCDAARVLVSVPGPRGGVYLQGFDGPDAAGAAVFLDDPAAGLPASVSVGDGAVVHGAQAAVIAAGLPGATARAAAMPTDDLAARIARSAAVCHAAGRAVDRPAPLYVKSADAAPSRRAAPVILP